MISQTPAYINTQDAMKRQTATFVDMLQSVKIGDLTPLERSQAVERIWRDTCAHIDEVCEAKQARGHLSRETAFEARATYRRLLLIALNQALNIALPGSRFNPMPQGS